MPHIQIKKWYSPYAVVFEGEYPDRNAAIRAAVADDADLTGADLTRAHLTGANLTGARLTLAVLTRANLTGANLTGAVLTRADLTGADLTRAHLTDAVLTRADLTDAHLTRADLTDAHLTDAHLTRANLTRANLTRADLTGANLTGADLTGANLDPIKADLWIVLALAKNEVPGLLAALREGRVDGSVYSGDCACLVGTLANVRKCLYTDIPGLHPDSSRASERWFTGISKGDTPETNQISRITEGWVVEWLEANRVEVPS